MAAWPVAEIIAMDVVAIDFETANNSASSACQLAAVVVRDSQIVAEHSWLIRPPRLYFSPRNIEIHGIRPADVRDAPTMEQVWSELSSIVDGQVLVAHNARFDIGVLIASLQAFDVACPELQFTCTRMLARAAWPGRSGYGLKPLGNWLGVQFKHHDALEDARCCAQIALTVERQWSLADLSVAATVATPAPALDLSHLEQRLQVTRGRYRHSVITSPRSLRGGRGSGGRSSAAGAARTTTDRFGFPSTRTTVGGIDPAAVLVAAANEKPLDGKRIVLLGPLRGLDLPQSQELIVNLGGQCQTQIGPTTDYVIACGKSLAEASVWMAQSLRAPADDQASATALAAPPTESSGRAIRLLSERQFRALLPAGKASALRD